jgi:myosin-crossreactive antigen
MVQPWLQHRKMKEVDFGSLERRFAAEEIYHVPYDESFEATEWEQFCVLYTSGSTGLSRPTTVNQISNELNFLHKYVKVRPDMVKGREYSVLAMHNTLDWQGFTH